MLTQIKEIPSLKRAVLNTLGSPESKRACEFAMDDFVSCYCSEPKTALRQESEQRL